jgi:putative ABC transport system permease protein
MRGVKSLLRSLLQSILLRNRAEVEMKGEMEEHLRRATERFVARGMPAREAGEAARREFGVVGPIEEQARDASGGRWLHDVVADLRYARRQFARTPLTTATMIFILTLGIGTSAGLFSLFQAEAFRPPAGVPDDADLVAVRGIQDRRGSLTGRGLRLAEIQAIRELPGFRSVATWWGSMDVALSFDAENGIARPSNAVFVSDNYFDVLGVPLAAGPGLAAGDSASRSPVAVISHIHATEAFGSAAAAIGRKVRVQGVDATIVGVAPPRFYGATQYAGDPKVWLPSFAYDLVTPAEERTPAQDRRLRPLARLAPGVSLRDAGMQLDAVAKRAAMGHQLAEGVTWSADAVRLRGDMDVGRANVEDVLFMALIGAVGLLILLVCTTTVSSLLVGRAIARRHEIGVRLAMGASRQRVVRQLLTECGLLTVIAGLLGLLVFWVGTRYAASVAPEAPIQPDFLTLAFTLACAGGTAILSGLTPALHAVGPGPADVLKGSSTGVTTRSRLQRTLVITQIALAQPLLLLLASIIGFTLPRIAFESARAGRDRGVKIELDPSSVPDSELAQLQQRLLSRLATTSGVVAIAYEGRAVSLFDLTTITTDATTESHTFRAQASGVSPGYFAANDIRVLRGREFLPSDTASADRPIIIRSDLATHLFGGADAIGRRMKTAMELRPGQLVTVTVIGVVDVVDAGPSSDNGSMGVFIPLSPVAAIGEVVLRTSAPTASMVPSLLAAIRSEAPRLPVLEAKTLAQVDREHRKGMLAMMAGTAGGGTLALLMAAVGLYAVIAVAVGQRRREIGLRLALGARPSQVLGPFITNGLRMTMIGLAIGLPVGAAGVRLVAGQLRLPLPLLALLCLGVGAAVTLVAVLATWLPARRAAGVSPITALRVG